MMPNTVATYTALVRGHLMYKMAQEMHMKKKLTNSHDMKRKAIFFDLHMLVYRFYLWLNPLDNKAFFPSFSAHFLSCLSMY